jgi:hypothetical protein
MTWLRLFIHRLCGLFLKRKMERDLEDEAAAEHHIGPCQPGPGIFAHAVFRTAAHPDGGRGFGLADRLRQRSQFVVGARNRASERNGRASRARRQSFPTHPPIADRKPVARRPGRRVGIGSGVVGQQLFIGVGSERAHPGFSTQIF